MLAQRLDLLVGCGACLRGERVDVARSGLVDRVGLVEVVLEALPDVNKLDRTFVTIGVRAGERTPSLLGVSPPPDTRDRANDREGAFGFAFG